MLKRFSFILASLVVLAGCSTSGDYKEYITAQAEANQRAMDGQKPLVKLVAQPGMAITGLHSLEVYTPIQAPVVQQARPSEWAGVVQSGFSVLGMLGGIKLGGDALIGLSSQVRQAGTAGYQFMNAPGPSTTSNYTYTNSYNQDSTHAPTIVTQPAPVIVPPADPIIVNPVIVPATPPVIVNPVVVP